MTIDASSYFPTTFAKSMARKVKLYNKRHLSKYKDRKDREHWERMEDLLAEFQQIAVLHGSEKAMNVYFDENLNDKQIKALMIIGDFSRVQVSGEAVNSMMEIINTNTQHKDYSKVIEAVMTSVKDKEAEFTDEDAMSKMIHNLLK